MIETSHCIALRVDNCMNEYPGVLEMDHLLGVRWWLYVELTAISLPVRFLDGKCLLQW